MPAYLQLCMESWRGKLPDYQLVLLDNDSLAKWLPSDTLDLNALARYPLSVVKDAIETKREVFLVGAKGQVARRLKDSGLLQLPPNHQIPHRLTALQQALEHIQDYAPIQEWDV